MVLLLQSIVPVSEYRVAVLANCHRLVEVICIHTLNMLCREMGDGKAAYYSSIVQCDAVCAALSAAGSQYSCEVELVNTLNDIRSDLTAHMNVTAELNDMFRGTRKSAIMIHDGLLTKLFHIVSLFVPPLLQ